MRFRIALFLVLFLSLAQLSFANNLQIQNVTLNQLTSSSVMEVTFDISWENSWRDSVNYDAAWVFLKYSTDGGRTWQHGHMKNSNTTANSVPTGFSAGTGTSIEIKVPPSDKMGAFVERSSSATTPGGGGNSGQTLSVTGVKILWDYGTDLGASAHGLAALASVKVMGIEMVYIPQGTFIIGSGLTSAGDDSTGNEANSFFQCTAGVIPADKSITYSISSETSVICLGGNTVGCGQPKNICWQPGMPYNNGAGLAVAATFPKGYKAFYTMKYEISQGQFRDFLNTLKRNEQVSHLGNTSPAAGEYSMNANTTLAARNGIRNPATIIAGEPITFGCDLNGNGTFNQSDDGETIAANMLLWKDLAAYADWTGLRPMSELEFEKASRGTLSNVNGEGSWGTAAAQQVVGLSNQNTETETASSTSPNGVGLINTGAVLTGPMRTGYAGTSISTQRYYAGSSYYGVMDLSGNVYETIVNIANSNGLIFNGANGNGTLSSSGNADISTWPGYTGGENTANGNTGLGIRGGSWQSENSSTNKHYRVSSRTYATGIKSTKTAAVDQGGRCVRSDE